MYMGMCTCIHVSSQSYGKCTSIYTSNVVEHVYTLHLPCVTVLLSLVAESTQL